MANILNVISALSTVGGTITKLRQIMSRSKCHNHFLFQPLFKQNEEEFKSDSDWYEQHNVPAYYSTCGRNIIRNAIIVSKIIKKHNIDIVHFYFNHEQSFAWLVGIMNPNVKMVRSIVGFDKRLSFFRRTLLKFAFPAVDNYVYISKYIKDLYEGDYPVLKKKNTRIIYNGPVNVLPNIKPMSQRHSVVAVGGLTMRKNSEVLIEAMNIIVNDHNRKDIVLKIIGDGERRKKCEDLIEKYDLKDNVLLIGFTDKVAGYLNECAIYVHPATTEGFGISVAEAMQMACPCVVANKGALPELIIDGETGFVVDAFNPKEWSEKIMQLWDNLDLREKMGQKSKQRAESTFSLSAFINNHDNFYSELVIGNK